MNLLVTGAWGKAKENIGELEKLGHNVCFLQFEKDELPCDYEWVEGVVCNGLFLSHPIEKFKNLRYIQLTSAGFDRVPMDYITEQRIEIHNARGVYSIPMAEFAITGVLTLYKKMRFFAENQKNCKWEKHRGLMELSGKTVVIVGCGSVGTGCAKRFAAFDCHVIGVNRTVRENVHYEKMLSMDEMDRVLPDADIVVLTIPLTDETRYLMNREKLGLLKETAVLVNIARGAVIETEALVDVIDRIGGAVLDVFEEEPPNANNPLWMKENVILTPHNSFVGEGNSNRLSKVIIDNLRR